VQEDHGWWRLHRRVSDPDDTEYQLEVKANRRNRTPAAAAMRSTLRRLREITEV
jgi:hypothetical protein